MVGVDSPLFGQIGQPQRIGGDLFGPLGGTVVASLDRGGTGHAGSGYDLTYRLRHGRVQSLLPSPSCLGADWWCGSQQDLNFAHRISPRRSGAFYGREPMQPMGIIAYFYHHLRGAR